MVFFGTGKYFEVTDNDLTYAHTQTFYGVWDNGAVVGGRSDLVEQEVTDVIVPGDASNPGDFTLRLTSSNTVDYSSAGNRKGWFMDLPTTGERVVTFPLLRGNRVIFTTMIPVPPSAGQDQCLMNGTGWLMEVQALNGAPLPITGAGPWDISGDGYIDGKDQINNNGTQMHVSGIQSKEDIPSAPSVVKVADAVSGPGDKCRERKYIQGTSGELELRFESCESGSSEPSGRQSWRQLR
jgi:type IV pilus assembly protein PilY1